jgi:hypothetical protein
LRQVLVVELHDDFPGFTPSTQHVAGPILAFNRVPVLAKSHHPGDIHQAVAVSQLLDVESRECRRLETSFRQELLTNSDCLDELVSPDCRRKQRIAKGEGLGIHVPEPGCVLSLNRRFVGCQKSSNTGLKINHGLGPTFGRRTPR